MEIIQRIPAEVIYVVMAAIGGIARYLQGYLREGEFMWRHFVAHTFVSSFSGYMFYQFAHNVVGLNDTVMPVVAGMGGWMGVEALKTIETALRNRLKREK